jgi:hypothetical protein
MDQYQRYLAACGYAEQAYLYYDQATVYYQQACDWQPGFFDMQFNDTEFEPMDPLPLPEESSEEAPAEPEESTTVEETSPSPPPATDSTTEVLHELLSLAGVNTDEEIEMHALAVRRLLNPGDLWKLLVCEQGIFYMRPQDLPGFQHGRTTERIMLKDSFGNTTEIPEGTQVFVCIAATTVEFLDNCHARFQWAVQLLKEKIPVTNGKLSICHWCQLGHLVGRPCVSKVHQHIDVPVAIRDRSG